MFQISIHIYFPTTTPTINTIEGDEVYKKKGRKRKKIRTYVRKEKQEKDNFFGKKGKFIQLNINFNIYYDLS